MIDVINGDNIEVLKQYPDNFFDAVVTDPPYGLGKEPDANEVMQSWITNGYHEVKGSGFMGKEWDAFVPQPNFWREVFRVLKPGGHVLAFYGTRTYDWGVMAMRFAGFEVRDTIQWHYGSGFPKSHNISKAIDKIGGRIGHSVSDIKDIIISKFNQSGFTISEFNSLCGFEASGYMRKSSTWACILPSKDKWQKIKIILSISDEMDNLFEEAEREILGKNHWNNSINHFKVGENHKERVTLDITAPATEEAKQWEGWGSALKPASEPIVLARKPLEKGLSIAENVLKYGTGGINIDGCRVGNENRSYKGSGSQPNKIINHDKGDTGIGLMDGRGKDLEFNVQGRFPANLIMTHHPECECMGLKKVKGTSTGNGNAKVGEESNGVINPIRRGEFTDRTDENGEETIEDWNCHPDCPIRIMDEQSGITKSNGLYKKSGIWENTKEGKIRTWDIGYDKLNKYAGDSGGASRFFYCAKASKSERNNGLDGFEENQSVGGGGGIGDYLENVNSASGKYGSEKAPNKNFHPTVKPIKLMQYLVRLITPPSGIVLDPFCGSGTTGIACRLQNFQFVGIEQDAEYCKIAEARINNYVVEEDEIVQDTEKVKKPSARQKKSEKNTEISTFVKDKNTNLVAANQLKLF